MGGALRRALGTLGMLRGVWGCSEGFRGGQRAPKGCGSAGESPKEGSGGAQKGLGVLRGLPRDVGVPGGGPEESSRGEPPPWGLFCDTLGTLWG